MTKKNEPTPPASEWYQIHQEIRSQSDRGAAIMGAALVQDSLKTAIIARFVNATDASQALLEPGAAIGSFGVQSKVAQALGIIGSGPLRDLDYIRDIRNKFAHWTLAEDPQRKHRPVTFSTQRIAAWASNLKAPDEWSHLKVTGLNWTQIASNGKFVKSPRDPRERYIDACIKLVAILHEFTKLEKSLDY